MDVGEKGAVEAMLHLSRPGAQLLSPTEPRLPLLPSLAVPPNPHNFTIGPCFDDNKPSDLTSGSSVSPSHSPLHQPRDLSPYPETSRPLAMRVSQLLTADSTTLPPLISSPVRLTPLSSCVAPPSLPLPPLKLGIHSLTEPLTPPFSPPVLPPLSSVTGLAPGHCSALQGHVVDNRNIASAPMATAWPRMAPDIGMGSGITAANNTLNGGSNTLQLVTTNMAIGATMPHQGVTNTSTTLGLYQSTGLMSSSYPMPGLAASTTRSTNSGGVSKSRSKRPYKKYYSNPTPSSHCHVCARTSKAVKFAVCARIAEGLCRKVTCYKCFQKFGWDWESAAGATDWVCVHCRGVCPEGRSQCFIYSRVNSKRESKRGAKKKKALEAATAAAAAAANATVRRVQMMGNGNASRTTSPGLSENRHERLAPVTGVFGAAQAGIRQRVW